MKQQKIRHSVLFQQYSIIILSVPQYKIIGVDVWYMKAAEYKRAFCRAVKRLFIALASTRQEYVKYL